MSVVKIWILDSNGGGTARSVRSVRSVVFRDMVEPL